MRENRNANRRARRAAGLTPREAQDRREAAARAGEGERAVARAARRKAGRRRS